MVYEDQQQLPISLNTPKLSIPESCPEIHIVASGPSAERFDPQNAEGLVIGVNGGSRVVLNKGGRLDYLVSADIRAGKGRRLSQWIEPSQAAGAGVVCSLWSALDIPDFFVNDPYNLNYLRAIRKKSALRLVNDFEIFRTHGFSPEQSIVASLAEAENIFNSNVERANSLGQVFVPNVRCKKSHSLNYVFGIREPWSFCGGKGLNSASSSSGVALQLAFHSLGGFDEANQERLRDTHIHIYGVDFKCDDQRNGALYSQTVEDLKILGMTSRYQKDTFSTILGFMRRMGASIEIHTSNDEIEKSAARGMNYFPSPIRSLLNSVKIKETYRQAYGACSVEF
jgi:hypothetical protein